MEEKDLQSLSDFIQSRRAINEDTHPQLTVFTDPKQILLFKIRAMQLRMANCIDTIDKGYELLDRSSDTNTQELRIATSKMLINALLLSHELGMSAEELVENIFDLCNKS